MNLTLVEANLFSNDDVMEDKEDISISSAIVKNQENQLFIINIVDSKYYGASKDMESCYTIPFQLTKYDCVLPREVKVISDIYFISTTHIPRINRVDDNIEFLYQKITDIHFLMSKFVLPILQTIDYLHNTLGYAHGDLTESNILVDPKTGNPYIIDFEKHFKLNESNSIPGKAQDLIEVLNSILWHFEQVKQCKTFQSSDADLGIIKEIREIAERIRDKEYNLKEQDYRDTMAYLMKRAQSFDSVHTSAAMHEMKRDR